MRAMTDDRAVKLRRGLRERLDKRSRENGGGEKLTACLHSSDFAGKRFAVKNV
jgi:hypothetical protein